MVNLKNFLSILFLIVSGIIIIASFSFMIYFGYLIHEENEDLKNPYFREERLLDEEQTHIFRLKVIQIEKEKLQIEKQIWDLNLSEKDIILKENKQ